LDAYYIDLAGGNKPFLTLIVPFVLTVFLLPHLGQLASRIGLVDQPNKRKIHAEPRPLVGGLAMSLAVALTGLLLIPLYNLRGFYAGLVLLVITGFLDDFGELSHKYKFVAQIIAAIFIIYFSKVSLHTFGNILPFGSIDFHTSTILITIIGIVGVCNAINMIDGLDGLAGGVSLTVFSSFAFLSFIYDKPVLMLLNISVCGSLIAFLIYNWHPARLFMGDAGSLFLGFVAGFMSIAMTQGQNSPIPPVTPLLVLAVPIVDTVTVMIKRLMKGRHPFRADKGHLHHILLKMGFNRSQTALIIIVLSGFFCSVAIAGTFLQVPEYYLFFLFMAYFIAYFTASFFIKKLLRNRKFFGIASLRFFQNKP
jgi:UDP-GlcNAc:undecaprenyl-phosphate/decaprenyl-phosphate GlcNAc-1-phosphate transferase